MKCPKCSGGTKISDTRLDGNGRRRKRKCVKKECGYRFTTHETIEPARGKNFNPSLLEETRCTNCGELAALSEIYHAPDGISVQRIYVCESCSKESCTVESPGEGVQDAMALFNPLIVKADGSRVPYDRDVLGRSLSSIRGKLLDEALFRELICSVDESVRSAREVSTEDIKRWTLDFLSNRNRIAYAQLLIGHGYVTDESQLRDILNGNDDERKK